MPQRRDLFDKQITPLLKGIAIIFMFALHLLKTEWMQHPEWIIDIPLGGQALSAILARTLDICIGIFAFITGYGWWDGFTRKKAIQRIIPVYFSYWVVLLAFCLPMRIIFELIGSGTTQNVYSFSAFVLSALAIISHSATYCWYISFFALAAITYRPFMALLKKRRLNGFIEVFVLCVAGIGLRFACRIVNRFVPIPDVLLNVLSHYFQWMPVVLCGAVTKRDRLLERMNKWLGYKIGKKNRIWIAVAVCVGIILFKALLQTVLNIYSNVDAIYMLPFMYGLVMLCRWIHRKWAGCAKVLAILGQYSMYMWLTHHVLMYTTVQNLLFRLRFPLAIVIVSLAVMLPIGYGLNKLEQWLLLRLQNCRERIVNKWFPKEKNDEVCR